MIGLSRKEAGEKRNWVGLVVVEAVRLPHGEEPLYHCSQNPSLILSNRKITRQQETKKVNGVKTLDLCLLVTHRPILRTLDLYHIPLKEQIRMDDKRQNI